MPKSKSVNLYVLEADSSIQLCGMEVTIDEVSRMKMVLHIVSSKSPTAKSQQPIANLEQDLNSLQNA